MTKLPSATSSFHFLQDVLNFNILKICFNQILFFTWFIKSIANTYCSLCITVIQCWCLTCFYDRHSIYLSSFKKGRKGKVYLITKVLTGWKVQKLHLLSIKKTWNISLWIAKFLMSEVGHGKMSTSVWTNVMKLSEFMLNCDILIKVN